MHFSKCKNEFADEELDPLYFGSYFTCAGSREITENKICDWRPGGAMLYCRRPDGPWIVSGVEALPESCSRKGEEIKRPALFSTIESSADWIMTTAGLQKITRLFGKYFRNRVRYSSLHLRTWKGRYHNEPGSRQVRPSGLRPHWRTSWKSVKEKWYAQ